MKNIKVGDRVCVTSFKDLYPNYRGFIYHSGIGESVDKFVSGEFPDTNVPHIVIAIHQDPRQDVITNLAIIANVRTGQFYVIGVDSIDIVTLSASQQAVKDLRTTLKNVLCKFGNFESDEEFEEALDMLYSTEPMIRLRNFIEERE